MDENSSAAMLATKRSACVTPEVNLRECTSHTHLPSENKTAHSGFETQRRYHQKSKNRGISGPTKRTNVLQKIFEKRISNFPYRLLIPRTKYTYSFAVRKAHTLQDVTIVELGQTMKLVDILFLHSQLFSRG